MASFLTKSHVPFGQKSAYANAALTKQSKNHEGVDAIKSRTSTSFIVDVLVKCYKLYIVIPPLLCRECNINNCISAPAVQKAREP